MAAATLDDVIAAMLGGDGTPAGRSQPADSHDLGIENSDQPQSTQTWMSGGGFMGG